MVIFGVIAVAAVAETVVAAFTVPLDADRVPFVYPVAAARVAVHVVPYPTVKLWAEDVEVFVTSAATVPSDLWFLYFSVIVWLLVAASFRVNVFRVAAEASIIVLLSLIVPLLPYCRLPGLYPVAPATVADQVVPASTLIY